MKYPALNLLGMCILGNIAGGILMAAWISQAEHQAGHWPGFAELLLFLAGSYLGGMIAIVGGAAWIYVMRLPDQP